MKIGNEVRVVTLPHGLPEGEIGTKSLFESRLGRVFPIVGLQGHLLELEVGEIFGKKPYMDSLWIEAENVELVADANSGKITER